MSADLSPRSPRHLRIFAVSLGLVIAALLGCLFGVRLEAVAPATGVVTARDLVEVRVRRAGLIEAGWYENGTETVAHAAAHAGTGKAPGFHRLLPGDELAAGQVFATLRPDETPEWRAEMLYGSEHRREPGPYRVRDTPFSGRADPLVLRAPDHGDRWLALEVPVTPGQAVHAGDLVATLAPVDPVTGGIKDLQVRLAVDERHFGGVRVGQSVRLFSAMHNHRLHGVAHGKVERLEPGATGESGKRVFHAVAVVTNSPFVLRVGASVKGEIVLGTKRTVEIILEH